MFCVLLQNQKSTQTVHVHREIGVKQLSSRKILRDWWTSKMFIRSLDWRNSFVLFGWMKTDLWIREVDFFFLLISPFLRHTHGCMKHFATVILFLSTSSAGGKKLLSTAGGSLERFVCLRNVFKIFQQDKCNFSQNTTPALSWRPYKQESLGWWFFGPTHYQSTFDW